MSEHRCKWRIGYDYWAKCTVPGCGANLGADEIERRLNAVEAFNVHNAKIAYDALKEAILMFPGEKHPVTDAIAHYIAMLEES